MFFFQAEDGIRDLVRSRGLGDVYKRQEERSPVRGDAGHVLSENQRVNVVRTLVGVHSLKSCLLYTSDAADERSSVDLGGRRIIKKKTQNANRYNRVNK